MSVILNSQWGSLLQIVITVSIASSLPDCPLSFVRISNLFNKWIDLLFSIEVEMSLNSVGCEIDP